MSPHTSSTRERRLGVEQRGDLAVEVGGDAVADVRLDQALEPVARGGLGVELRERLLERRHRLPRVDAQVGEPLDEPREVPDLRRRHEGEGGLVRDRRRQRGVGGEPLERDELGVGQHAEEVDDPGSVLRVVHQRRGRGAGRRGGSGVVVRPDQVQVLVAHGRSVRGRRAPRGVLRSGEVGFRAPRR